MTETDLALTEWALEEGWLLRRKFMREIEDELDLERGQILFPLLSAIAEPEIAKRWIGFASKN
jgi:hypothetical protein